MAALADESIFDKIKRFQRDMRDIDWGQMPDEYARAIPENPNYGYMVDVQNAMRASLMPYLERFGLAIPDTRQGVPADYYNPVMRAGEASDFFTPPLNSPNFSVNYMTNAPRLFGRGLFGK